MSSPSSDSKSRPIAHSQAVIRERREQVLALLSQGLKGKDIAAQIKVDPGTVSRDIQYIKSQSRNYLNDIAKETLPYLYLTSIEGIREILKESWNIYDGDKNKEQDNDQNHEPTNLSHKIAALRLAKECNEAIFNLTIDGPTVMKIKQQQERLKDLLHEAG